MAPGTGGAEPRPGTGGAPPTGGPPPPGALATTGADRSFVTAFFRALPFAMSVSSAPRPAPDTGAFGRPPGGGGGGGGPPMPGGGGGGGGGGGMVMIQAGRIAREWSGAEPSRGREGLTIVCASRMFRMCRGSTGIQCRAAAVEPVPDGTRDGGGRESSRGGRVGSGASFDARRPGQSRQQLCGWRW